MNWGALISGLITLAALRAYSDRWLGSVLLLLGLVMVIVNLGAAAMLSESSEAWLRYASLQDPSSFMRPAALSAGYAFVISGLASLTWAAASRRKAQPSVAPASLPPLRVVRDAGEPRR